MTEKYEEGRSLKVGKLRPSQAVTQHGPGAVIDLPELSVIVAGTDHWYAAAADRISEPRLENFINAKGGLYRAPRPSEGRFGGIPAFVFPNYLVCPDQKCRRLAPFDAFKAGGKGEFRCLDAVHGGGGYRPVAFPARFMVACSAGHLDDFPWRAWAHGDASPCDGRLKLVDLGSTGGVADLLVRCSCGATQGMGEAFKSTAHKSCSGRQPWMGPEREHGHTCTQSARTILRGASNAYFSVVTSAISIPPWSDPIHQDLAPHLEKLEAIRSADHLQQAIDGGFVLIDELLAKYTVDQIWQALSRAGDETSETDLKPREHSSLRDPEKATEPEAEFEAERRPVPDGLSAHFDRVVAVKRLREVRALRAFTRIDSYPEVGEMHDVSAFDAQLSPICSSDVKWRPATELRGEGVYLELVGSALAAWEDLDAVRTRDAQLEKAHAATWQTRGRSFGGVRFVLLHTLAHVLIREMSLHAGYSSSALRERIYSDVDEDMAGILIYTASSDSEGSLGGLVDLARPKRLVPLVEQSLHGAAFCASDPLCSTGHSSRKGQLNGAACHACLLIAETSCEAGNRMLDRAVLVPTLSDRSLAFFSSRT